jgi:predicted RNase H-like HicB family nuclease
MTIDHYHVNVFWSQQDACWVTVVPDLKSCAAFGETAELPVAEVEVAIAGWIDAAKANNMQVPEPFYRPVIYAAR